MKVLAFGEILFDIIEGKHFLGGAPLNFAAHISRLGAESYILSSVGADPLGKKAIDRIEELGVKTIFIQQDNVYKTGTVEVFFNNGQPDYIIFEDVAYDNIKLSGNKAFSETGFDILYFGTLAQRKNKSRATLVELIEEKQFKHIFYDVNLRKGFYSKEILYDSIERCSILKLNDEEVIVLGELFFKERLSLENFAIRIAREFRIEVVIITTGATGCLVYENEEVNFVPGYPAKVVDTVGAGDSFSAAFLYHYFHNKNPIQAADIANRLGAFVASSRGPIPDYSPEILKTLKLKN